MEWKPGWPAEVDEWSILITPLSDPAECERTNSKIWREISAFDYMSVRFRAADSDLVAFCVICQDLNTMKTKTITQKHLWKPKTITRLV